MDGFGHDQIVNLNDILYDNEEEKHQEMDTDFDHELENRTLIMIMIMMMGHHYSLPASGNTSQLVEDDMVSLRAREQTLDAIEEISFDAGAWRRQRSYSVSSHYDKKNSRRNAVFQIRNHGVSILSASPGPKTDIV